MRWAIAGAAAIARLADKRSVRAKRILTSLFTRVTQGFIRPN
jgi:hypothetical protein